MYQVTYPLNALCYAPDKNEVRAKDLIVGDVTEKDVVERKKVVTWGENTVHEFKERRTRREKLWRFIKKVVAKLGEPEEFSANEESTTTTTIITNPLNYQTSSKPMKDENFERELEELTKSTSTLSAEQETLKLLVMKNQRHDESFSVNC
ncbi:hypothetical protein Glove_195g72 [Diversispora epigaea]|uniref:Uncharacterized protein n=1 Tax=Diversispora epigaea TaxID=1348612 RepID=A0A397IS89_9GLOM|nr:hypothetical protein Glove_195g72 [Diversispora epigaea]